MRDQLGALRTLALWPYRGCRAGAKLKARHRKKHWRFKPFVPSVVMGNANSLANKTGELAALVKNVMIYRDVERANQFNTFFNRFDCPVPPAAATGACTAVISTSYPL